MVLCGAERFCVVLRYLCAVIWTVLFWMALRAFSHFMWLCRLVVLHGFARFCAVWVVLRCFAGDFVWLLHGFAFRTGFAGFACFLVVLRGERQLTCSEPAGGRPSLQTVPHGNPPPIPRGCGSWVICYPPLVLVTSSHAAGPMCRYSNHPPSLLLQ